MHSRLSEIVEYVEAQRAALLAATAALPEDQWPVRPAPDRWSVSDVFEHLHRVERGSARLVGKLATEARAAGHPSETETASLLDCLAEARLTDRSRKFAAPERVAPEGGWSRARALEAVAGSRAELHATLAAADGLALQGVRHAHARLGDIDLYQWILFIGQHEARHVPQVAEIVEALAATA
jgi:DinB superfamily